MLVYRPGLYFPSARLAITWGMPFKMAVYMGTKAKPIETYFAR